MAENNEVADSCSSENDSEREESSEKSYEENLTGMPIPYFHMDLFLITISFSKMTCFPLMFSRRDVSDSGQTANDQGKAGKKEMFTQ